MPLILSPTRPSDTLSWARIRSIAYSGTTHDLLHSGPICESSILRVAEDRKRELVKPNAWHWKVVDTDLEPSADDPLDNDGQIIAIAAWSLCNVGVKQEESGDKEAEKADDAQPFTPPELRLDALSSLINPLRAAQKEIMGTEQPYLMLNSLATHPDQRGRGAAKLLLDWGLKKADSDGLVTYLDGTVMARPIYEKNGFKLVKDLEWDRVPWGGEGRDWLACMVRQPQESNRKANN